MKPTLVRNRTIYQASLVDRSRLLCGHLSKDLHNKYHRRSIRVTEGDTVKVLRGEFKGVTGKITKVSLEKSGVAIEGIKKEKLKGGNVDVFIQTSNLLVTDLNVEDKWRQNKLEGKKNSSTKTEKSIPKTDANQQTKEKPKTEQKVTNGADKEKKSPPSKEGKESKTVKKPKTEGKQ